MKGFLKQTQSRILLGVQGHTFVFFLVSILVFIGYNFGNHSQENGVQNVMEVADVALVIVPLPAQGHLNQLLHLSRLVSAYDIPVHFVDIPPGKGSSPCLGPFGHNQHSFP
ncbi:unnamed protein product [Fraxinus pennsylvanica]|uniref:Glycosyltransferase N-terminal domain-containing protein n=1 Tax=Fraxinus pennsylvanica TaxID=56036 RepID=A0AAD2DVD6_9LAMI|nr:unnamed protein product [Fraxinus pennsylvanica]